MSALQSSQRLTRVSWLPSLLIPEKMTVPLLREAAARFQADLLLVYRSPCQRFQDYRLFGTDKAKTYCVAEGILLDVRTGVIPFSTATTQEARVEEKKAGEDISFYETMQKAEAQATAQALLVWRYDAFGLPAPLVVLVGLSGAIGSILIGRKLLQRLGSLRKIMSKDGGTVPLA